MKRIGAIAAMTSDRVIGLDNDIPWRYPEDWKRFKKVTLNSSIIMGRKTWESIGSKPLPKRQNIVISRSTFNDVLCANSITQSLALAESDFVWFIGGGNIYTQALEFCDVLDITWVPDIINCSTAIRFPEISSANWISAPAIPLEGDPRLRTQSFTRAPKT